MEQQKHTQHGTRQHQTVRGRSGQGTQIPRPVTAGVWPRVRDAGGVKGSRKSQNEMLWPKQWEAKSSPTNSLAEKRTVHSFRFQESNFRDGKSSRCTVNYPAALPPQQITFHQINWFMSESGKKVASLLSSRQPSLISSSFWGRTKLAFISDPKNFNWVFLLQIKSQTNSLFPNPCSEKGYLIPSSNFFKLKIRPFHWKTDIETI